MKRKLRFISSAGALAVAGALLLGALPAFASTVAYWRFEEGPADALITHVSGANGVWSADTLDSSGNGNALSAWSQDAWANEYYKADVPAPVIPATGQPNNFSIKNAGGYPGLWNESLATWTPAQWTIEACFKPEETDGYRTIVGRDSRGAATQGTSANDSALYFQIRPDERVAVIFQDVAGYSHMAESAPGVVKGFPYSTDPNGTTGRWYAMAATSDGVTLKLYLNDLSAGTGYQLVGTKDLAATGSPNTALTPGLGSGSDWSAGNFTVMRGMWNGGHTDRAYGFIDEVRLSDVALDPTQFLFAVAGDTEVRGTVTDKYTGQPVAGATVTIGSRNTITDSAGKYSIFDKPGQTAAMTVTSPYAEAPYTGSVTFPTTGYLEKNVSILTRPHVDLTTANGYSWKIAVNTGGTVDYSAETGVDESAWLSQTVPASCKAASVVDDAYIWYRVHFDLPAGFLEAVPGRLALLSIPSVDDCDVTWLNGTKIGETGGMPNPPLGVQPTGHVNPPTDGILEMAPGAYSDWSSPRNYYFPTSLLKPTGNVLAIKVWDLNGGAGVTATPTLQIAKPTGAINGTVKVGGVGVAGFRVTAMGDDGTASDTALTDATGAFTLSHVAVGNTIVGAVKPGYTPVVQPVGVLIGGGVVNGLSLSSTAVTGGEAPVYDDFNGSGTAWEAKWTAQSLLSSDPINAPTISLPGVDAATRGEIPGSITIDGGLMERAALLSKATLSKYASLVSASLVSALPSTPEPTGTLPNAILYISGQGVDASMWTYTNQVELDLEGYQTTGGAQRVRAMIWAGTNLVNRTNVPIPVPVERLNDVTPANPLNLTIARTGSVYDFFVNGIRIYWCYANVMPDHRFAIYSYPTAATTTWDYVLASGLSATTPVAGDLNGNGLLDAGDTLIALRIAGGLEAATSAQVTTGNVAGGDARMSILDALRLHQAANGRPL
jgi:hypothetical protein